MVIIDFDDILNTLRCRIKLRCLFMNVMFVINHWWICCVLSYCLLNISICGQVLYQHKHGRKMEEINNTNTGWGEW